MTPVPSVTAPQERTDAPRAVLGTVADFDALYDEHFPFVWRNVKALGVLPGSVDDVTQDVFVVVHRRLCDFDSAQSTIRTWLYGILRRVVLDHRRTVRRKPGHFAGGGDSADSIEAVTDAAAGPHAEAERSQGLRTLQALLETLDDERREVFVLAEIEQISAVEIAELTGTNLNTTYARLRSARKLFEQAVARHRAAEGWRKR